MKIMHKIRGNVEKYLKQNRELTHNTSSFTPYSTKLKKWEVALLMGILVVCFITSWLSHAQDDLAEGMIRLHVIANSNSEKDQQLKLEVRDKVLEVAETLYQDGLSWEEITTLFEEELDTLAEAGVGVAGEYTIEASLTQTWFPTKIYDNFSLPAGEYTALQITIGEGEGENWWCVAYPPLCLGAASQTIEQAVEAGNFTTEQQQLITGDGYVLKFKSIEILEQVKKYFST